MYQKKKVQIVLLKTKAHMTLAAHPVVMETNSLDYFQPDLHHSPVYCDSCIICMDRMCLSISSPHKMDYGINKTEIICDQLVGIG